MTTLTVNGTWLDVRLRWWEQIGAFHRSFSVPLSSVTDVDITDRPFSKLRGMRLPGTGFPTLVALGTWRGRGMHDFVAIYRNRPAVVIDLARDEFERLLISVRDPGGVASILTAAVQEAT